MTEFRYFSCRKGRVVPRYGTDAFIGAKKTKEGFVWEEGEVVAIPTAEIKRFRREYASALTSGRREAALKKRTEEDYEKYLKDREAKEAKALKEAEEAKRKAEESKEKPSDGAKAGSSKKKTGGQT